MPHTIQQLLVQDTANLASALAHDPGSARIEAQLLLQHALNVSRAYLLAHPEHVLNEEEHQRYSQLLERRLAGEPVAYILGEREFYGLSFRVTPDVLIPRPETELLVELALEYLPQQGCALDLGTGSGAIALSIAHARPDTQVLACDASAAALAIAQENAQRLGAANADFVQSHWYDALDGQRFDLVVSNPPYVAAGDPHLQQGDLPFEPECALVSGDDGLDDIRHIVAGAHGHLNPGGRLLLEHGYDQAERVRELLRKAGFTEVFSARDLAGIERVSGGCLTV